MNMDPVHLKIPFQAAIPGTKEVTVVINIIPTGVSKLEQGWFDAELE